MVKLYPFGIQQQVGSGNRGRTWEFPF